MAASLVWTDIGNSSSTKFTVRHIEYTIKIIYAESTDLVENFEQGWWYGIITYQDVVIHTQPQVGMKAAKTASLKITSNINGIPPLPIPSPPPLVILDAFSLCSGALHFPNLGAYVTGVNLLWYTDTPNSTPSSTVPTRSTSTPGVFNYWVSQTIDGRESPKVQMVVTIYATPRLAYIGPYDYSGGSSINLVTYSSDLNNSGGTIIYEWSTDGIVPHTITDPTNFTTGGYIHLSCISPHGCESSLDFYIIPPTPSDSIKLWTSPIREGDESTYAIVQFTITNNLSISIFAQCAFYSLADEVTWINQQNIYIASIGWTGSFSILGSNIVYTPGLGDSITISILPDVLRKMMTFNLGLTSSTSAPQTWDFLYSCSSLGLKLVIDWDFGTVNVPSEISPAGTGFSLVPHVYPDGLSSKEIKIFHNNTQIDGLAVANSDTVFTLYTITDVIPISVKMIKIDHQKMQNTINMPISALSNLTNLAIVRTVANAFSPSIFAGTFNILSSINLSKSNLTSSEVDKAFNDFVANTPSFASSGSFLINGQAPSAPPTSSSLAARTALLAAGWILTTD